MEENWRDQLERERKLRKEAEERARLAEAKVELAKEQVKLAKLQARIAEIKAETAEAKARIAEAKAETVEANPDAELREMTAVYNGVFYAPFPSLWNVSRESFTEEDMNVLKRTKIPNFPIRTGVNTLRHVYVLTADRACDPDTFVKDDGSSARTSHISEKVRNKLWPCDIFRNDFDDMDVTVLTDLKTEGLIYSDEDAANIVAKLANFQQRPSYQGPDSCMQKLVEDAADTETEETETETKKIHGDIAHLVPTSPLQASLYYNVGKWVFGLGNETPMEAVHKMIHGCKHKNDCNRISNVGLKHFACNKIRLMSKKAFFDKDPSFMIIPTLSIAQIIEWNGQGYDAIVLMGAKDKNFRAVAEGLRFTRKGVEASEAEIEICRVNVVAALKALAASLSSTPSTGLTDKHLEELKKYRDGLAQTGGTRGVKVPSNRNTKELRPIRKVSFVSQNEDGGHPAPDPMLLLIKSSIIWSKYHNQQLLPAGEIDSDDEISESSMLAETAHWEIMQAAQRENLDEDILGSTIDIV